MKNLNIFLFAAAFVLSMTACITKTTISNSSGLSNNYLDNIPHKAQEVVVTKSIAADSLYEEIYTALINRGHRILSNDKDRFYLTTEGSPVRNRVLHRMTLVISEQNNASQLNIKTEWKTVLGGDLSLDWTPARWAIDPRGLAFAETIAVAEEIKDSKIAFVQ